MSKLDKPVLVAVYGSLLTGLGNHRVITHPETNLLGEDVINNHNVNNVDAGFSMYSLGSFPAVTLGGDTPIKIEVYEVNTSEQMRDLDRLEGYPSFYNRTLVDTKYGLAWIYYIEHSGSYVHRDDSKVESGDWRLFLKQKYANYEG